ncbi:MAG: HAMP domain-containing methyl-accepting chemotaxis protein [Burkholderiaceae bacterium]
MFKNLSVSVRLAILVAILALTSIIIGASGLRGMTQAISTFQFVNDEHLVHLRDLKIIADMYAVNIVDTAHKVRNKNISWEEGRKNLAMARKTIKERWDAHPPEEAVGEEKALVERINKMLDGVNKEVDVLEQILAAENAEQLIQFTVERLYPAIDPISEQFGEYIDIQLREADKEFKGAEATESFNAYFTLALILGGLAVSALFAVSVMRSITRPLSEVQSVASQIERTGDFSLRIRVDSSDEVGKTAKVLNRMLEAQQAAVTEVNGVVSALAAGDFQRRIQADLKGDLGTMKSAVNDSVETLEATMAGLNRIMRALQDGDFSARSNVSARGEYRKALDQVSAAMAMLQSMLGEVGSVMNQVAQGDLTGRVRAEGRGDLAALKDNINRSLEALSGAMQTVNANTRQVAAASNETSSAIGQISDGAQNQTLAISQVATAVRQTSASVADVSRNTEVASQRSRDSVTIIRDGMAKMERMVEVVSSIAANSEKINKITEVIEKIANKTNLLSLNAAIEAARAGEHGKGFAVVADEVGKLAVNSAESSQEIAQLVQQAVAETNKAVEAVREVSADMAKIEHGSQETDAMLQRISAALEQQSSAVEEINANLSSLDKIARSNAAAAEQITATVIELSKIADATRQEVQRFQI